MTYSTIPGTTRKITQTLYDETELEELISETDIDVIAWVNSAVRKTTDFTEEELTTTADVIRLASDCFCAFRVMSEQMEGTNLDVESLATVRYEEAKSYIRMFCAVNDIIPSFDDVFIPVPSTSYTTEVQTEYGYATGTDTVCIG